MSPARSIAAALLCAALTPAASAAQLASRIAAADDGVVRLEYAARPDVEVCDQGIRMGERHMIWRWRGRGETATGCRLGWMEVEVRVQGGAVQDVEVVPSRFDRARPALDLGEVPAAEASEYFFSLARSADARRASSSAILPAVLADVPETWRPLLALARERTLRRDTRKQALFWLGQEAADAATEGLAEVARDDDEEQDVRDAAVFALSQRPDEEGVPILIELATTAREAKTRRSAMFWLAQSDDDRVVEFFERVLLRRGTGH